MSTLHASQKLEPPTLAKTVFRLLLGAFLVAAGFAHLTVSRAEFQAQVPRWLPLPADFVVVMSGVVELGLGSALIALPRHRSRVGRIVAAFFVLVFPGNISQSVNHIDAFGLNSDAARTFRLLFQPVLVVWALWSTDGWHVGRNLPPGGSARER